MHQPSARVVRLKSNNDKAIHWKENDVSARRVIQCQIEPVWRVFLSGLLKDCKVMAVEMDLVVHISKFPRYLAVDVNGDSQDVHQW